MPADKETTPSMADSPDLAAELEFVKALAIEAAVVAKGRCRQ